MMAGKARGRADPVPSNFLNSREEKTTTIQPPHSHSLFQTIQRRQRRERMVMDNNMCDSIKFNLIQYHLSSNAQIDSLI